MLIFHHDHISSTSTEALRLLNEGKTKIPFAVTAKKQSAGRGQRSRSWQSPEGNIYLSIGCEVSKELLRLVPLMTACILCEWMCEKLSQRPQIKWPNDLLINGKKIAGILCESSWSAEDNIRVVIGIGVNVNLSPQLITSDYESACMSNYLVKKESVESLTLSFLEFWDQVKFQNRKEILNVFESYHIPRGHLWCHKDNPEIKLSYEGISDEGHLLLRDLITGQIHEMMSTQHSFRLC